MRARRNIVPFLLAIGLWTTLSLHGVQDADDRDARVRRLIGVVMGPSPLAEDLRRLADDVGGRVPGTEASRRGVRWAVDAFRRAGVDTVTAEPFRMPAAWSEGETRLEVLGSAPFAPRVVSLGWSPPTSEDGIEALVVDVGDGSESAFASAGDAVRGALVLVHSGVLETWADLFHEYLAAGPVIGRARAGGAAGILWMSSREQGLLYRHQNRFDGEIDVIPQALIAREDALRIARLVASGASVRARLVMPNRIGGPFEAENVIAEIRGTDRADEVVMIGAHLDSWDLGSGTLDNGANCAMVVEVARAIRVAGIAPRRTLRFVLWNGEEQGLLGSRAWVRDHRDELDRVVAYVNFDGGTGRVTGYSLGGRHDLLAGVNEVLRPLESWGMNAHTMDAGTGTDHVDFLLEGIPTLNANQEEANYITNYHASSDTFDKADIAGLTRHAAFAGVTLVGIADREARLGPRLTRAEIGALIGRTGLETEMRAFDLWADWTAGRRGRHP